MAIQKRHRVLILGGGFAGIKAALELCESDHYYVSLISNQPEFCYYGALYRVATGANPNQSNIPLTEIFRDKPLELIIDTAQKINQKTRQVILKSGRHLSYDRVVIAIGGEVNYFNITGLSAFALTLHSLDDAKRLKAHLHKQLIEDSASELNYVIVGGGPTGIELAGELRTYLKRIAEHHRLPKRKISIDLVEAAPRLIPKMPKDMSKKVARRLRRLGVKLLLEETVQAETADALMVGGKPIRSHTVIWTAGVKNPDFFAKNDFELAENHLARVDQYLQADSDIFIVGDNASTPYAGMAQTALYDAKFVAVNLKRQAAGKKMKIYKPQKPVYVIPVGRHWAAVLWGPLLIYGWKGWLLRRLVDLEAYRNFEPWWPAGLRWLSDFTQEDCPDCATNPIHGKIK